MPGVDLVRVADRGGERTGLAGDGLAEKDQAFRITPVSAAFGHDPVHRDIPALGVNGLQLAQLVADADDDGPRRQAHQSPVEEAGAVAEAVAGLVPSEHRHQHRRGNDRIGAHRIGNAERAGRKGHAGLPFPENERLPSPDDHGQSRHRAVFSQLLGQRARVIFTPDRPVEGQLRDRETWKRAPEMAVEALAEALERRCVDSLTRRDQPDALALPPGFQLVWAHGGHAPFANPAYDRGDHGGSRSPPAPLDALRGLAHVARLRYHEASEEGDRAALSAAAGMARRL